MKERKLVEKVNATIEMEYDAFHHYLKEESFLQAYRAFRRMEGMMQLSYNLGILPMKISISDHATIEAIETQIHHEALMKRR